jgi:hypothetical protein
MILMVALFCSTMNTRSVSPGGATTANGLDSPVATRWVVSGVAAQTVECNNNAVTNVIRAVIFFLLLGPGGLRGCRFARIVLVEPGNPRVGSRMSP